jgi:hypothetical protein
MSSIAKQTQNSKSESSAEAAARWESLENPGENQFKKLFGFNYKITYDFYKFDWITPPHLAKPAHRTVYTHGLYNDMIINNEYSSAETCLFAQDALDGAKRLFHPLVTRWNPITGETTKQPPWRWFKQTVSFVNTPLAGVGAELIKYGLIRITYDEEEFDFDHMDVHVFNDKDKMLDAAQQLGILRFQNINSNEDDNTLKKKHFK